jgi:hypothetical protein
MGFFDGKHSLAKVVEMVETALKELGFDPAVCRDEKDSGDKEQIWNFWYAPETIGIVITVRTFEKSVILDVHSPVVEMPRQNLLPFYRRLLELNLDGLSGPALGITENLVILTVGRPTDDLDPGELMWMIHAIGSSTEQHRQELIAEFGCET